MLSSGDSAAAVRSMPSKEVIRADPTKKPFGMRSLPHTAAEMAGRNKLLSSSFIACHIKVKAH